MLNRAAIIICPRQPLLDWVAHIEPNKPPITLKELDDLTIYLISETDSDDLDAWLIENYRSLFEHELESWYTERSLWPEKRDWEQFRSWIRVEHHSSIIDLDQEDPLEDDDLW